MMNYTLNKLIDLAPYPVRSKLILQYTGYFRYTNDGNSITYRDTGFMPTISINSAESNPIQICTLVHEIGHALHYRRKCKCYTQNSRYLKELHATRFELRFLLRYKLYAALEYAMESYIQSVHSSPIYQQVSDQIKTEKIWQKVIDYLDS